MRLKQQKGVWAETPRRCPSKKKETKKKQSHKDQQKDHMKADYKPQRIESDPQWQEMEHGMIAMENQRVGFRAELQPGCGPDRGSSTIQSDAGMLFFSTEALFQQIDTFS